MAHAQWTVIIELPPNSEPEEVASEAEDQLEFYSDSPSTYWVMGAFDSAPEQVEEPVRADSSDFWERVDAAQVRQAEALESSRRQARALDSSGEIADAIIRATYNLESPEEEQIAYHLTNILHLLRGDATPESSIVLATQDGTLDRGRHILSHAMAERIKANPTGFWAVDFITHY